VADKVAKLVHSAEALKGKKKTLVFTPDTIDECCSVTCQDHNYNDVFVFTCHSKSGKWPDWKTSSTKGTGFYEHGIRLKVEHNRTKHVLAVEVVASYSSHDQIYDNCRNSRVLLADIHRQYADRHMNLQFMRERTIWQSHSKNQIDVSFSYVCPFIDSEFRHNTVKLVCGSTRLSPRGSAATLTMIVRNSSAITG